MSPFGEADSDRFFGRDEEIQDLLQRLRVHPFLTVIGPSGSGKSSLIYAGLIPALRVSGLFGPGGWLVRTLRPGEVPLDSLAEALQGSLADPGRTVTKLLSNQPGAHRVLLVVDQLEELFTLAKSGVEFFQEALLRLSRTANCLVVLTVRADFYPDLMATPLWPEIQKHRMEVLPLGKDGLSQAIVRPAQGAGVFVEEVLVERLLADAAGEPGVLPLVQETLVLLWEHLQRRFLPMSAYENLGDGDRTGLQAAMARRADATLAELNATQQKMARRIFLRLIQFGEGRADTRRQQAASDLRAAGDEPNVFEETLRHFADRRLLTLSGEEKGGARRVDIAHEALITGWRTLHQWVSERRDAEQTRRRLEAKVREWVRLGRGRAGLLDEVELKEASDWLESADATELGYDATLSALVEASRAEIKREAERRRRNSLFRLASFGAVTLLIIAVLASIALGQAQLAQQRQEAAATAEALANQAQMAATTEAQARQTSEVERVRAEEQQHIAEQQARINESRRLAAQSALKRDQEFDLALRLGVEASRLDNNFEVRKNLYDALMSRPQLDSFLHGHTSIVLSVAFSPDGKTLASGSGDDTIILWDLTSRQRLGAPLTGHKGGVYSVAFSPDGKTLASGSCGERDSEGRSCIKGEIYLWDVASGQRVGEFKGHRDDVLSVAFSPDGKTLASGSGDKTIILWDVASRQPQGAPLTGHKSWVHNVVFSPDGKTLASDGGDDIILLWDVSTRQPISQIKGYRVTGVVFSPDGKMLAGGFDRFIFLWDANTRQLIGQFEEHTYAVSSVAFSPDGKTLASGSWDKTIVLWDLTSRQRLGAPLTGHKDRVQSVAFSPDGKTLASGGYDGTIILWDLTSRHPLGAPLTGNKDSVVYSVAFSPDGKTLASGGCGERDSEGRFCTKGEIYLWDVTSRQPLGAPLTGHTNAVRSVAFSPDGKLLASRSDDYTIILWDVTNRQPLGAPLTGNKSYVTSVAFSPDGKTLASGGCGERDSKGGFCIKGEIYLWNVTNRQLLGAPLTGHKGEVYSIAFSPDGKTLASGGYDDTIILWDAVRWQPLGAPLTLHAGGVSSVSFSPDGKILALASGDTILFWDVVRRQPLGAPLTGHTNAVRSVAFSPDGKLLASRSDDYTIILWDVTNQQPLGAPLTLHLGGVSSVSFSPDGKTLASGGSGYTIILWDVDLESWKARACRIVNRNLTRAEWAQYFDRDPLTYDTVYAKNPTCLDLPLEPLATPTPQSTATP